MNIKTWACDRNQSVEHVRALFTVNMIATSMIASEATLSNGVRCTGTRYMLERKTSQRENVAPTHTITSAKTKKKRAMPSYTRLCVKQAQPFPASVFSQGFLSSCLGKAQNALRQRFVLEGSSVRKLWLFSRGPGFFFNSTKKKRSEQPSGCGARALEL